jgi:hypothetical protein
MGRSFIGLALDLSVNADPFDTEHRPCHSQKRLDGGNHRSGMKVNALALADPG